MGQYTVQKGDTLSGIGSRLGVDWKSITGYRSGNPNLIYPGEVLSYGGGTPAPAPAPAPAAPAAAPKSTTQQQVDGLYGDLTNFDKTALNPIDIYNQALEKLGITDARTRVTNLRQALIDNGNLLDSLSGNISQRTSNSLVTEAQRQRLVASEAAPIVGMGDKLNEQFSAAQGDYQGILGEGKTQADYTIEGQNTRRAALMDRLKIKIDQSKDEEEKARWQKEFDRQVALDKQNQSNKDREFALAQQSAARSGSGGGSRTGGGGGGSSSTVNPMAEFKDYIASQFKSSGANPSRQTQDAWANAWFSSKGIENANRQVYWDAFNTTYNRPANPYNDWLYKR